jgi:hypothetical protein
MRLQQVVWHSWSLVLALALAVALSLAQPTETTAASTPPLLSGVVLTTAKDTRVFELSIVSALRHLVDVGTFYVITPSPTELHERLHAQLGDRVVFVDERIFPFNGSHVDEVMVGAVKEKGVYPLNGHSTFERTLWGRIGWYLQQLLKLYAGRVLHLQDFVLLDSDVMWFRDVRFVNGSFVHPVTHLPYTRYNYASSGQYHRPYFSTLTRIAGVEMFDFTGDVFRSGITHHLVVVKDVLESLFATAEALHPGLTFWQVMLNQSALEITCRAPNPAICGAGSALSEYELYFNFARQKFPETMNFRPLLWANGPMPGLLFWPASAVAGSVLEGDKGKSSWMGHKQSESEYYAVYK